METSRNGIWVMIWKKLSAVVWFTCLIIAKALLALYEKRFLYARSQWIAPNYRLEFLCRLIILGYNCATENGSTNKNVISSASVSSSSQYICLPSLFLEPSIPSGKSSLCMSIRKDRTGIFPSFRILFWEKFDTDVMCECNHKRSLWPHAVILEWWIASKNLPSLIYGLSTW